MTDTRTVWEQTGKKPVTRFGDIIPCEAVRHRFQSKPAYDRWVHPDDAALHLCVDCSVSLGQKLRAAGWRRIAGWKQPA